MVPVGWDRARIGLLSGDEPHYLIIAEAVVRDHSLNVFPVYARDREERRIVGPTDWRNHCRGEGDTWYSVHGVGLPLVLSPVFAQFGALGVRVALALFAGLIPFLVYYGARLAGIGRAHAVGIALCTGTGLPFVATAGQIYPDLVTGVLVLALTLLAWTATTRTIPRAAWVLAALILAFLPWLHVKNVLVAGILAATLAIAKRKRARLAPDPTRWWPWLVFTGLTSLALLLSYHLVAFNSVLGPYSRGPTTNATLYQASMIFLGLHFDQAQGVFFQQPLFLVGLVGLPMFARRSPFVALGAAAAYVAILAPNAFHPCWYGCFSMSGRFMWAVAALWCLPLISLYAELGAAGRSVLAALGAFGILWQLRLATVWYTNPGGFMTSWSSRQRNSLFAAEWTGRLPSFYDFDRYLSAFPNLVALLVALALIALGAVIVSRLMPARGGDGTR